MTELWPVVQAGRTSPAACPAASPAGWARAGPTGGPSRSCSRSAPTFHLSHSRLSPRAAAIIPMENPYCSCERTRVSQVQFVPEQPFPMGDYVRPGGIRIYPYSFDFDVNPTTFDYLSDSRYTGVHAIGSVWCNMLMDVFCHFADALSPSLSIHLLKVEGGAAE